MNLPYPKFRHIDNALYIENHVQRIITQQEKDGVRFNIERAKFYIFALQEKQERLYRQIRPHLSIEVRVPYGVPLRLPFKKDGSYSAAMLKWYSDHEGMADVSGPFTRVTFGEPDLSKRSKLIAQLLRLGWKPAHFTEKGYPQLTFESQPCPSLEAIDGTIGRDISRWYTCRHRQAQIKGLVKLVRSDRRISSSAITIGTPTFRFRHRGVVNIPRSSSYYGSQLRSLFCVMDRKRRMVGHDAKGLELRTLAHYINSALFTLEVVNGDPHERNRRDAGLPTRDDAKTFIYAFIYGAGDAKLGKIVGAGRAAGARLRARFLRKNPELEQLIKDTRRFGERGYLLGLDGRRLTLRKDKYTGKIQTHKALNTLNQSAGAIVMKWSMVLLDHWVRDMKLDVIKLIDMHDEAQASVAVKDIPMYKELARHSIVQAGQMLNLNVPLDADVSVGLNWSHTH